MTPFVRKKVLETSRLEGGNAYDWIVRDPKTGLPRELIPVPWQLVQPWRDMGGASGMTSHIPSPAEAMPGAAGGRVSLQKRHRNGLKGTAPWPGPER